MGGMGGMGGMAELGWVSYVAWRNRVARRSAAETKAFPNESGRLDRRANYYNLHRAP